MNRLEGGGLALEFVDSWKYEVAAYEVDKLLGLDLVPPTVERRLQGTTGSLQMWVEGVITEWDRVKQKREPPDPERWNRQVYSVRLLHALTLEDPREERGRRPLPLRRTPDPKLPTAWPAPLTGT